MGCHKRIDRALENALHLPLGADSRYILISDCHRGEGTSNDNFLKNQHLYSAAMEYYMKKGFFYLELGDGEELWENRCRMRIERCHENVYEMFSSVCWRLSRFLVRYLWKPLEQSGVNDPTSAARNYRKAVRYEKCLVEWTKKHDTYLAAGHSHRPRLPENEGRYLNAGSCVHPRCITAIEIENMQMTLVKWKMATRPDMTLYVAREELAGPVAIH